jgi:hypothetical protein
MALQVNIRINKNNDRSDGYLAIDTVGFIRGQGQMGGNMPNPPKFCIQVFYTIYTDNTKTTIIHRGMHTIPWDDTISTTNAFAYSYDKLKALEIYNGATDC